MKKQSHLAPVLVCVALVAFAGCQKSDDTKIETAGDQGLPADLFLATAPSGVVPIATLKEAAKEGDTVTIQAVVGGTQKTYVADRAVMTVIDASLANPCTAPGHTCDTPWDYCCAAPEVRLENMASVWIVGADNRPLAIDLETVDQIKPMSVLTITGTVGPRADRESLVIQADGIYVES